MTRNYPFRKLPSLARPVSFHPHSIIRERINEAPIGTLILLPPSLESRHPLLHPVLSSAAPSSSSSFSSRRLTRRGRKTIMSNHIIDRPLGSPWSLPLFSSRAGRMAFDSQAGDFPSWPRLAGSWRRHSPLKLIDEEARAGIRRLNCYASKPTLW